jgi:ribosomal protein S18 acetylase RimI-like enzyme
MIPAIILYKQNTANYNQVFTHLVKCDEYFVPKLSEKTDIAAYTDKIIKNSITFEAWENEELVGLIAAYFNDVQNKTGFITNVSILKEFSGKGIASDLLKQCINYGRQNNFSEIGLEVSVKNDSAIKLYKKYNFVQEEIKNDLLVMKINLK